MKLMAYLEKEFGAARPGDVTWSHAVNSLRKLERTLNDRSIMMIESDIRISSTGNAVAVHPPETESDLSFDRLLNQMSGTNKGLKLDFKDPEILERCLETLQGAYLSQPVLLNADILQGNGANPAKFSPFGFLALCREYYPKGILSIGWTTTADANNPYTKENVETMSQLTKEFEEITFPVRACLLPNSWAQLSGLIQNPGRTLSIWNNEPVDDNLRDWIKANTDPDKIFYDFIDDNKDHLKLW